MTEYTHLDDMPDSRPVYRGDLVAALWYPNNEWLIGEVDNDMCIHGSEVDTAHHVVLLKSDEELDRLVDEVSQSGFKEVVEAFPMITTGDFSPEDTFAFNDAIRKAVCSWVQWNYPKEHLLEVGMHRKLLATRHKLSKGIIVLYYLPDNEGEHWVTWEALEKTPSHTYGGHYFSNVVDAVHDFEERVSH